MTWNGIVKKGRPISKRPHLLVLLLEQIHSFLHPCVHPSAGMCWTPGTGPAPGAEMSTELTSRETDLWTNPDTMPSQGQQQKMQGRAVTGASLWMTHGRTRVSQRGLPRGGVPCWGKSPPVRAWAGHWGMELQAMQFGPTLQRHCTQWCWVNRILCPISGPLLRELATFPCVLPYSSPMTVRRAGTSF